MKLIVICLQLNYSLVHNMYDAGKSYGTAKNYLESKRSINFLGMIPKKIKKYESLEVLSRHLTSSWL